MIRFSLHCDRAHQFEAWFRSNEDYENQCKEEIIRCPVCNSPAIKKTLMAPTVATAHRREQTASATEQARAEFMKQLRHLAKTVRANAENVGSRFAEEARKIHFGEISPRAIYGKADAREVASLVQDGIDILPLPTLPEDQN